MIGLSHPDIENPWRAVGFNSTGVRRTCVTARTVGAKDLLTVSRLDRIHTGTLEFGDTFTYIFHHGVEVRGSQLPAQTPRGDGLNKLSHVLMGRTHMQPTTIRYATSQGHSAPWPLHRHSTRPVTAPTRVTRSTSSVLQPEASMSESRERSPRV